MSFSDYVTITQGPKGTNLSTSELTAPDLDALGREDWIDVQRVSKQRIEVTSKRHVGVIGLPSGKQLRIKPKINCDLLYLLAYAGRLSENVVQGYDTSVTTSGGFIDMMARLFVTELRGILQRGLHKSYQRTADEERYIRGQFDATRQIIRQGAVTTKFACKYDELTHDVPINHAVYWACEQLESIVTNEDLAAELQLLRNRLLSRISSNPPRLTGEEVREIELTRLNEYYHRIKVLSALILESAYFETVGKGPRQFDRFLIDIRSLFEHVLFRGFTEVIDAPEIRIDGDGAPQNKRVDSTMGSLLQEQSIDQEPLQQLQPDIFVSKPSRENSHLLVADAKWKAPDQPSRNDLYQVSAYQSFAQAPGVLVYPDINGNLTGTYEYQGAEQTQSIEQPLHIIELKWKEATTYDGFCEYIERSISNVLKKLDI